MEDCHLGLKRHGYECFLGVDIDDAALKTFAKNHPHARALNLDLSLDENIEKIVEIIGEKNRRYCSLALLVKGFL